MALSDAMSPFSSTGDLIARARTAFQSGRHAEAEKRAAEARTHDRASLDAIEILALAHRARGDAAGTERLLREAIAIDSRPRRPHDDLAMMLFDTGRVADAETACRAAIAADPGNPQPEMMLGNILSEREELVAGAAHLRRAIALAGEHPQLLANLGRNLQRQCALSDAEPLLRRAVAAMPDALPPLAWLAELLEQARRFDEASAMLDRAERLARAQGSDVTLQRAALLSRTEHWRDGLALLDAEPSLSGAALLQRGRLRDRAGRYATMVVAAGYALLLIAPGLFPSAVDRVGIIGYAVLALGWLVGSIWLMWRVPWRAYAISISGLAVVAFLSLPFMMIVTGCYVFNQCP